MFVAVLLSACGSGESSSTGMRVIDLTAGSGSRGEYRLTVPERYLMHSDPNVFFLKAAYPGMVPYSKEIRQRFYKESGGRAEITS